VVNSTFFDIDQSAAPYWGRHSLP